MVQSMRTVAIPKLPQFIQQEEEAARARREKTPPEDWNDTDLARRIPKQIHLGYNMEGLLCFAGAPEEELSMQNTWGSNKLRASSAARFPLLLFCQFHFHLFPSML